MGWCTIILIKWIQVSRINQITEMNQKELIDYYYQMNHLRKTIQLKTMSQSLRIHHFILTNRSIWTSHTKRMNHKYQANQYWIVNQYLKINSTVKNERFKYNTRPDSWIKSFKSNQTSKMYSCGMNRLSKMDVHILRSFY